MVSTSIAKTAPAANAMLAAITSGEKVWKILKPGIDATPEIIDIPTHIPKIYKADRPACFMPAALDNASGTFERKIATAATIFTTPPCSILNPIAIASGIPSINAPIAIAFPLPSFSDAFVCFLERFRPFSRLSRAFRRHFRHDFIR
ncbi:MAG: hypothetical protein HC896_09955 [Bacteroidales bacterium]|nr:hypothetical protein [Bacteroidales bacterium]